MSQFVKRTPVEGDIPPPDSAPQHGGSTAPPPEHGNPAPAPCPVAPPLAEQFKKEGITPLGVKAACAEAVKRINGTLKIKG